MMSPGISLDDVIDPGVGQSFFEADLLFVGETRVFYRASGIANVQPPRQTPQPGAIAVPTMAGQETALGVSLCIWKTCSTRFT